MIKKQSENLTFTSLILELFFSAQGQRTAPILKGIKTRPGIHPWGTSRQRTAPILKGIKTVHDLSPLFSVTSEDCPDIEGD